MANYTVTLTDAQDKALSFVCASNQDWINNAVSERARLATLEIVNICIAQCTATNTPFPATQDAMVDLAFANGWVNTGAERNAIAATQTTPEAAQ